MPESCADHEIRSLAGFGEGLDGDGLARLRAAMERREFGAGEVLIRQGEPQDWLLVIGAGELVASITAGTEIVEMRRVISGGWIGEVEMLEPGPALATVAARSAGWGLALDARSFESFHRREPGLSMRLLARLTREMATGLRRSSTLSQDVPVESLPAPASKHPESNRLAHLLKVLFGREGNP